MRGSLFPLIAMASAFSKMVRDISWDPNKLGYSSSIPGRPKNIHKNLRSYSQVPVKAYPGTGRNELCPCGSGTKYKKCCGR